MSNGLLSDEPSEMGLRTVLAPTRVIALLRSSIIYVIVLALCLSISSRITRAVLLHIRRSPAWDPNQHNRERQILNHRFPHHCSLSCKCKDTSPLSSYARFAKAVISQSRSLMKPLSWKALKLVFSRYTAGWWSNLPWCGQVRSDGGL